MPYIPTDELVVKAWLTSVPELLAGVAGTLPQDTSSWADNGFVQIATVGGSNELYYAKQNPAMQIDAWAVNVASAKPPWGKANQICEIIRRASLADELILQRVLTIGAGYNNARVMSANVLTRPVKMRSDEASYAHYQFDMEFSWIEVAA